MQKFGEFVRAAGDRFEELARRTPAKKLKFMFVVLVAYLFTMPWFRVPTGGLSNVVPPGILMQITTSVVLLSAGLFVILSKKYTPQDKHWAYTTLGTILGFWLKQ